MIGYLPLRLWEGLASGRAQRKKLAHRLRQCSQFGTTGRTAQEKKRKGGCRGPAQLMRCPAAAYESGEYSQQAPARRITESAERGA